MSEIKDRKRYTKEAVDQKDKFDKQVQQQEYTVGDKKKTADTARNLNQAGTREGAAAVRKATEGAGKAIDGFMDKQKGEHDGLSREGKQAEGEVKKASDASAQDGKAAEQAAKDLKHDAGKGGLKEAANAGKQDSTWLEQKRREREKVREGSETKTIGQVEEVKDTKVQTQR